MEALFRSLPALLDALPDNENVREAVVFAAWRKIAGDQLGTHTAPVRFKENRLLVAVPDNSWKKNLASLSSQMIFKINTALNSPVVTYIEFIVDTKKAGKAGIDKTVTTDDIATIASEITPELRQSAAIIEDEKLRHEFLLAAAICLARRAKLAASDNV
jgi:Protein of unknown function (DUF721).